MASDQARLDTLCVNTLRMLALDMVEAAKSGHPGMPLGAAAAAYVLFSRHLRFNPQNPAWPDRDRFVLSAGHASALLYALLHCFGYDLPLAELKRFRQWGSLTPGHPEHGVTPGVEATTGPLGHGFTMGVGMALAERFLAAQANRPGHSVVDHRVYALVSDGDLMEGISGEAASLAGTLGLGKLVYLYDDNQVSIEGPTSLAFTEDVAARFAAYGWQVLTVADGGDLAAIDRAITEAEAETARPSLVKIRTRIGLGSPKEGSCAVHGEPLGKDGAAATKKACGWPEAPWHLPAEALAAMAGRALPRGAELEAAWEARRAAHAAAHPAAAALLAGWLAGRLPADWDQALPAFAPEKGPLATRAASGKVINALAPVVTNLVGGSADLAPSNKTWIEGSPDMRTPGGRNLHCGVREHAMGAILNGLALHGGVLPFGGTFLVFSDFCRPALRLAALMQTKVVYVFTHDSVAVGEDGPTHQPVEQLAALRAIPGLTLLRPADANETSLAWGLALTLPGPVALALSRQNLPILDLVKYPAMAGGVARGGYVLAEAQAPRRLCLIASGAEVHLALAVRESLETEGIGCRVVSLPSFELFAAQDRAYREAVLPPALKARLGIEAGSPLGWREIVGEAGEVVALERFGASAPGGEVLARLGFNPANLLARARALL